jgi:hypothetical protein
MIDNPAMAHRVDLEYDNELEMGRNVTAYLPLAITETLKITVLDSVEKELKKCAPYLVLPGGVVREVDNTSEYRNIMYVYSIFTPFFSLSSVLYLSPLLLLSAVCSFLIDSLFASLTGCCWS